jgi:MraZ protein
VFRGEFSLNMDAKGRVAVPTRLRERLSESCAGRVVVTISLLNRCLTVYPYPDWQEIENELRALPALDAKAEAIRHLLIGHAAECDLDSQGRVLVAQSLRDFASLGKRIKLIGQGNKFELWDESQWQDKREELLGRIDDLLSEPSESLSSLVL